MENKRFVDQRRQAVERFFAAYGEVLAAQGTIVATYRQRGSRRLGPYFKLTCRAGRRQVAVYLGSDKAFVEEIRERLHGLQETRLTRRKLLSMRRSVRHEARLENQRLDVLLASLGLSRQGHEIRGWRSTNLGTHVGDDPWTLARQSEVGHRHPQQFVLDHDVRRVVCSDLTPAGGFHSPSILPENQE